VNADYEIVLDRLALTEIIVDALDKNRSLIFSGENENAAQLGLVWPRRSIEDTVIGNKRHED
jgi:hypothetical protein